MGTNKRLVVTLLKTLERVFGPFTAHLLLPSESEIREKTPPEIEIPSVCSKLRLALHDHEKEFVARLLLSEEAATAGSLERAELWLALSEEKLKRRFPKLEKPIRLVISQTNRHNQTEFVKSITIEK